MGVGLSQLKRYPEAADTFNNVLPNVPVPMQDRCKRARRGEKLAAAAPAPPK